MIAWIIHWSIKNRCLILVASLFLIAAGIYALKNTPVDAIPDLSDVQVIVKTSFPGQAPQVVENQVTYPLTTAMLAVPGATTVRGYSFFGDSYVYVLFKEGTDLYWARSRVLEYLNQVSNKLPPNVRPELGPDATGVGWVYEYALVDKTGKHDLAQLRSIQDWFLKYELQTLPGVAEVATIGGMVRQYQVILNPNHLRAYGLSLKKVKHAIQQGSKEVGGSVIELGEAEYMVKSSGYLKKESDIESIPLGTTKNGTPILLSDVASIRLGAQMRRGIAELNGQGEVVGGVIVMRYGSNALSTIAAVKSKLNDLKKSLPMGVEVITTYDRSSLIHRAMNTLRTKLIEEMIIVSLICLLFLFHFRSSLIIVISLPIAILIAFTIMYWQGISANIMSLGGIAIAIGAMVDAAIVMIENVHKHLELATPHNQNRWEVIQKSVTEVGPAVFFSLLIITLSFLPVFALQSQEGKLFSPLAFTKTYAMAAAAGLSITLVPVLIGYFVRGKVMPEKKNPINRLLIALYRPMLEAVLKFPKLTLFVAFLVMMTTYWPLSHLGSEFMPDLDEGDWMYMPTTLPGISIGKAQHLLQQTDKLIKTFPEVSNVFGKIGRAETATDPAPLTMIETVIQLKPRNEWRKGMTVEKLREEMNQRLKIPGLTNAWVLPIKTRLDMLATGIKTPIGIKISGPSLEEIQKIGKSVEKVLSALPNTRSVYSERAAGGRYLDIQIDRYKAARYNLSVSDIQEVISTAIGGASVASTVEGLERYPINLRYPQRYRNSVSRLKNLPIITESGAHITLEQVAKINIINGPPVIKSENARLTGWVLVDIHHQDIGSYVKLAKEKIEQQLSLPSGYSLTWSGQYEYMKRVKERLVIVIPLTLAIVFLLLYFSFKRISEVIIIMGALPLALTGGFWLLYLLGYHLSVAVGIGLISLSGIAIEIGILMLVYLNQEFSLCKWQAEKENRNLTEHDVKKSIVNGALLRIRPIIMTVSSIIIGLLPIMFGEGTGSEVMKRISAPMVGGMTSATILALAVIPAIFLVWKNSSLKK